MKKIRFHLISGANFDMDLSGEFDLVAFAQDIQKKGFFLTPDLYVPHSAIVFIAELKPGQDISSFHTQEGNA